MGKYFITISFFLIYWNLHFRPNLVRKYEEVHMLVRKAFSQGCWCKFYTIFVPLNNIWRRFCVHSHLNDIIFSEFHGIGGLLPFNKHSPPIRVGNSFFPNNFMHIQIESTTDTNTDIKRGLYLEGANNSRPFLDLIVMDIGCIIILA